MQDSSPIATVSPFTCTGTSTVPNHPTYTYHFTYDGSTSGALDESNAKGTTSLAPALHCTIRMSQPPPGPGGGGNFVSTVAGLECNSWSDGPSSGYQVSIAIDPSSTHATGTLRLCIDDNCPTLADLISNDTITNFSCDGVSVKP